MKPITAELKDRVLEYLVNTLPVDSSEPVSIPDICSYSAVDIETINSVLNVLQEDNYVSLVSCTNSSLTLILNPSAPEFLEEGCYTGKRQIAHLEKKKLELSVEYLELELTRLKAEIDVIKPVFPERARVMLEIVANIASVAGIFIP
jgi:hypothetical protein